MWGVVWFQLIPARVAAKSTRLPLLLQGALRGAGVMCRVGQELAGLSGALAERQPGSGACGE